MEIKPSGFNYLIVHTIHGSFHIKENQAETKISMYDHFTITVIGKHKSEPFIILDSDEFPTHLEIRETESKWKTKVDKSS